MVLLHCYICFRSFDGISKLIQHIRRCHFPIEYNLSLKCCGDQCTSVFKSYSGYRRHLGKCKQLNNEAGCSTESSFTEDMSEDLRFSHGISNDFQETISEPAEDVDLNDLSENINLQLISFLSQLLSGGIPLSTIVKIVANVEELVHTILESSKRIISANSNAQVQFNLFSTNVLAQIGKYRTEYKIKKHCSNNELVQPVEICVGVRSEQVLNKTSISYIQKNVSNNFIYVPILDTLTFILKNPSVHKFFSGSNTQNIHLTSFSDGSNYKESNFFKDYPNAIQLQLYYDEFECAAPLGTKTGSHKMGAFYFVIRNFPPELLSKLTNIHLLALFYSNDLKSVSINEFLKPIIKDIQILELEGLSVSFLPYKLKGTLVALSHDNLGGNTLFRMVESFNANHFCRVCLTHKNDVQFVLNEKHPRCQLRNRAFYDSIPDEIIPPNTYFGIKEKSCLNNLSYFHLGDVISVDIMHDILEGVAQYEIKLILNYVINEKLITLKEINRRIFFFNYGVLDMNKKPSPINLEKSGSALGERAAQTWCLARYLPLILADIIPKLPENKWDMIDLLLRIINICFAPVIPFESVDLLEILIHDHHSKVKEFGHLLPKHHIIVHYPRAIRSMGPLLHIWCMRFEAKHGYFKDLVHKLKNFKNIPYTLALRHQMLMRTSWKNYSFTYDVIHGPTKIFSINDYEYKDVIKQNLDIPQDVINVVETKYVTYNNFTYNLSFFICSKVENSLPTFHEIIKIILIEDQTFFVTKLWRTDPFLNHLNAFPIEPVHNEPLTLIHLKLLKYKEPYEKKQAFAKTDFFIVPKHIFV